jgi:lipoprotein-anchoring transpeptidase ErfK/SrfK
LSKVEYYVKLGIIHFIMLKSHIFHLFVALMTVVVLASSAYAITWNGLVTHPRTRIITTKWDTQLDNVKVSADSKLLWVDLAKQRLSVFENKKFITSYQILTGKDSTPTPAGTYKVNYKQFVANDGKTLRNAQGRETARVSYWMPFIGDDYAFHNASWRQTSELGRIQYRKNNGSGGCVNMSYSDVADMYNRVNEGTVVYISK